MQFDLLRYFNKINYFVSIGSMPVSIKCGVKRENGILW